MQSLNLGLIESPYGPATHDSLKTTSSRKPASVYTRALGNGIVEGLAVYRSAVLKNEQDLLSDAIPVLSSVTKELNKRGPMRCYESEELTHILWSCLPRPSPLHRLRCSKGEPTFPSFLNDLIGKTTQPKTPRKLEKPSSIGFNQFQVPTRAAVKTISKRKPARSVQVSIDSSSTTDSKKRGHIADQDFHKPEGTFYTSVQDCIDKKDLAAGRQVFCSVIREGFHQSAFVACHLIRMFAVCGSLLEANHVFSSFAAPDSSTWSAIISAHACLGQGTQAIVLYEQMMQANVQPSIYTYIAVLKACSIVSSLHQGQIIHHDIIMNGCSLVAQTRTMLIIMYAMCGRIEDSYEVYDSTLNQDHVMSNVMMAMSIQYGHDYEALVIFGSVLRLGADSANVITLVLGVKACTNLEDRASGKLLQCLIIEGAFELNTYACSALMAMYMEFGDVDEACYLFARLPKRTEVTWSSIIAAFVNLNDHILALKYFNDMQQEGVRPNDVTYISVLSACSHAGMLHEGLTYFNGMQDEHGIPPTLDHYNCMVDLLARVGYVIEAEDLLYVMPFKPKAVGCTALLSHCKTHGNVAGGQTSFHYNELELDFRGKSDCWHDAALAREYRQTEGTVEMSLCS